jgi:hypothetical protein
MTKDEFMGKVKSSIGQVGHLSVPNATDPFKNALYSAFENIYDIATEGGGKSRVMKVGNPDKANEAQEKMDASLAALQAELRALPQLQLEVEALTENVATLTAALEALTKPTAPVKGNKPSGNTRGKTTS